uniref:Uncharacterized protein n=1 Tax=Ananas comosus var. bracteatus TaxID=296719 RepID=A0A6V7NUR5_ANACO|nr:unnamed protein product [Ananas comosus var. bracteatus]
MHASFKPTIKIPTKYFPHLTIHEEENADAKLLIEPPSQGLFCTPFASPLFVARGFSARDLLGEMPNPPHSEPHFSPVLGSHGFRSSRGSGTILKRVSREGRRVEEQKGGILGVICPSSCWQAQYLLSFPGHASRR